MTELPKPPKNKLMKKPEFLESYQVSNSQFYREVAAGRLIIRKIGRATRVDFVDAEAWAASLPKKGGEASND